MLKKVDTNYQETLIFQRFILQPHSIRYTEGEDQNGEEIQFAKDGKGKISIAKINCNIIDNFSKIYFYESGNLRSINKTEENGVKVGLMFYDNPHR